jgi:trehalose synthase
MAHIENVPIGAMALERFASVLSPRQYGALTHLVDNASRELNGRVIWSVNSTAKGGGVVEMLRPLLAYARGIGVDARWNVITGGPEFFAITKRLHNHLHGFEGDGGELGDAEHEVYERTLAANGDALVSLVRPQDVVILHDPQTAGLVETMRATGAIVVWHCHVGLDQPNDRARKAWDFLRSYVLPADAYVFSRAGYAWEGLARDRITVVRPCIDAFSAKNFEQTPEQSLAILAAAGIVPDGGADYPMYVRDDGTPGRVDRTAEMVEQAPLEPDDRVVLQVSRWDRLKDPLGVLRAFVEQVARVDAAHLLLAGPSTAAVADDPEGAEVLLSVQDAWHDLPPETRRRVHLASLPMDDIEENAAIVNAVQRHASVVLQKSLAEGFGLTVAEAMWKTRPVVASRVGGIRDQIDDGKSGLLISDPRNMLEVGSAVVGLLSEPDRARRIGLAARASVQQRFLSPQHLQRYFEVIRRLVSRQAHATR